MSELDPQIKRVPGVRNPLDALAAQFILQTPRKGHTLVPDDYTFFQETSPAEEERVAIGLPAGERVYTGDYYGQLGPTCFVWGVANGIRALGVPTNSKLMRRLHAFGSSNQITDYENRVVEEFKRSYPSLDFDWSYPAMLKGPLMTRVSSTIHHFEDDPSVGAVRALYKNIVHPVFFDNAHLIKHAIDKGKTYIVCVSYNRYRLDSDLSGNHAVAVVGYRVSEEGYMDVQIIDPAGGILWMGVEHLSSAGYVEPIEQRGFYSQRILSFTIGRKAEPDISS